MKKASVKILLLWKVFIEGPRTEERIHFLHCYPISCHWPLSIHRENIRKSFWQPGGMKWVKKHWTYFMKDFCVSTKRHNKIRFSILPKNGLKKHEESLFNFVCVDLTFQKFYLTFCRFLSNK